MGRPGTLQHVSRDLDPNEPRGREPESPLDLPVPPQRGGAYLAQPGGPSATILYMSPSLAALVGCTPEQIREDPRRWTDAIHPDDRETAIAEGVAAEGTGRFDHEYRIVTPAGDVVWLHDRADLVDRLEASGPIWAGLVVDVSPLRRLHETEARYHALIDQLPSSIYLATNEVDFTILYNSPAVGAITGHTAEEWERDPDLWRRMVHPGDVEDAAAAWARSVETGEPFDVTYRILRDGVTRWIHDRAIPIHRGDGSVAYWEGVSEDVTETRETERRLRASERRTRALIDGMPAAVFILTADDPASITYMSRQIETILGYPSERWLEDPTLYEHSLDPAAAGEVMTVWRSALAAGGPLDQEVRLRHADGRWVWVRETLTPVRGADGGVLAYQGFVQDITRRREAEDDLQRALARYRSLVEQLPAVVYVLDAARGELLYVSPSATAMFGTEPAEILADPDLWERLLHPDDRDRVVGSWHGAFAGGVPFHEAYRASRDDGSTVWVDDACHPVRNADGGIAFWQGVQFDISSTKDAEIRLRASEARYRALVEQLPAIVYVDAHKEHETISNYLSPNVEDLLGYPISRFVDDPGEWMEILHPEDLDRVYGGWKRAWQERDGYTMEYRLRHADGSWRWFRDTCRVVGEAEDGQPLWQGVMVDVTAEKVAEEALRASESKHRALVEQLPAVVYLDVESDQPLSGYVSPNALEILGYDADELALDPRRWRRIVHPGDLPRALRIWSVAWLLREPYELEYRIVKPDGSVSWIHDTARPIRTGSGRLAMQGVLADVTATKRIEEDLARSEARYRALVEQVPAIVYEMGLDDERRTIYVSPHVEHILGYSRQEWLDQPDIWTELLHPDDREIELAAHDLHNITGESWRREYRMIAADGRVVWVRDQAELIRDAGGDPLTWHGVMLDITDRKDLEERLRRANDELEFRVLARTTELAEANEMMSLEIGERRRVEADLRRVEERYRRLVERLPAVTYVWDADHDKRVVRGEGTVAFVSPQLESLLGYSPATWIDDRTLWRSRVHPHDRERVYAATDRSERHGDPFALEYRYLTKDGRVVWVLDQATLLERDETGRPVVFQGVMLDVTERKEAEAKALRAEQRYRLIAEEGPVVAYLYELERGPELRAHIVYVSPQLSTILGRALPEWADAPLTAWAEHAHPDDRDLLREELLKTWETGAPWSYDFRSIAADGGIVWFHSEGRMVATDDEGRPRAFHGVLIDVTADREARTALEEELANVRAVVEGAPAVAYTEVTEASGLSHYTYISPRVEEVFGYRPDELMAEPDHFLRMVHPEDRERVRDSIRRADETGEPWDVTYRAVRRDGRVLQVHGIARPEPTAPGEPRIWHGLAIDVTPRDVVDLGETSAEDPKRLRSEG
jgi:PAS domain S-box-containing protein